MLSNPIVGQRIEALDCDSIWSSAFIIDVAQGNIKIRYDGWDEIWNETLQVDSSRVAPIYTRTSRLKCFVSLVNQSNRKNVHKDKRSSLWPCILHTRMPSGDNASKLLKMENNVFVQPYRSGLLAKYLRDKIKNGGIWLDVKHIYKWECVENDYDVYPSNFELAYHSCLKDASVPGYLANDNIFMEGSCLHETYIVHKASEQNKLIDLKGWESDLVDLNQIESPVCAEIGCKVVKKDKNRILPTENTADKSDDKILGLWELFPELDSHKSTQNVAQLLPSRHKYAAKRVCEFFMFCYERQRIWFQMKSHMPRPWTKDILLHSKQFCNLFRELDTGTQYLHRHIVALHKEYNNDLMEPERGHKKRKRREKVPIGTRLMKGCDFEGTIVEIPSETSPYYKILYVDGDEEEMTHDEVVSYLKKDESVIGMNDKEMYNVGTIVVKRFELEARVIHSDARNSLHTIEFDVNGLKEEVSDDDLKGMILAFESKYGVTPNSIKSRDKAAMYVLEVIFMVICYRLINRKETFERLGGIPTIKEWKSFVIKLQNLQKNCNHRIFTTAHQAIGLRRFLSTMNYLVQKDLAGLLKLESNLQTPIKNKDLEGVTKSLQSIENIGPFFAWQITCDLLQSNVIGDCDEHGYSLFGPGAKNGLRYIFPENHDAIGICKFLVRNQTKLFECLHLDFKSLAGERELTLKVIEHALCEFYKYNVCRRNLHKSQHLSLRNYHYTSRKSPRDCCNTCGTRLPKGDSTSIERHKLNTMTCIDCYKFSESSKNLM